MEGLGHHDFFSGAEEFVWHVYLFQGDGGKTGFFFGYAVFVQISYRFYRSRFHLCFHLLHLLIDLEYIIWYTDPLRLKSPLPIGSARHILRAETNITRLQEGVDHGYRHEMDVFDTIILVFGECWSHVELFLTTARTLIALDLSRHTLPGQELAFFLFPLLNFFQLWLSHIEQIPFSHRIIALHFGRHKIIKLSFFLQILIMCSGCFQLYFKLSLFMQ